MIAEVLLSNNQLSQMEACPRAMAFRTRARLRRREASIPMHVGAGVHAGIAALYSGKTQQEAVESGLMKLQEGLLEDVVRYEDSKVSELRYEIERLVRFYDVAREGPDVDDCIRPLAVENHFNVELAPGVRLIGVIDLFAGSVRGSCIVDHKTSRYGGPRNFAKQELDGQLNLYAYAAKTLGLQPWAVGLNILVKTKEPRIERHWVPVNEQRVESYVRRLRSFGLLLASYPDQVDDILELPGNPGLCRKCPFAQICEYPEQAAEVVEMDFERAKYEMFDVDD